MENKKLKHELVDKTCSLAPFLVIFQSIVNNDEVVGLSGNENDVDNVPGKYTSQIAELKNQVSKFVFLSYEGLNIKFIFIFFQLVLF
jgi:hypothetical protein